MEKGSTRSDPVSDEVFPAWKNSPGVKCKGLTVLFYASRSNVEVSRAKDVCLGRDGDACCAVLRECQRYALEHLELYGVWGGMSERDRQKVRRARRRFGTHIINPEGVKFPQLYRVSRQRVSITKKGSNAKRSAIVRQGSQPNISRFPQTDKAGGAAPYSTATRRKRAAI